MEHPTQPLQPSEIIRISERLAGRPVLLLGDTNVDVSLTVQTLPAPGGDALASSQIIGLGGSVTNTAILLHRMGALAQIVSCVGEDAWSAYALDALAAEGMVTDHLARTGVEQTSLNIVVVTPDGERTMFACRGASAHLAPADVPRHVVARAEWLHLSGYALLEEPQRSAALAAISQAAENSVPVSLDLPVGPTLTQRERVLEALPGLRLLVVGRAEAQQLVEADHSVHDVELAERVLALGPGSVALKLGSAGAIIAVPGSATPVPSVPAQPVDTTGAGDAFCAGIIAGMLAGLDVRTSGRLAALCGAAATEARGAGRNLPTLDALLARAGASR